MGRKNEVTPSRDDDDQHHPGRWSHSTTPGGRSSIDRRPRGTVSGPNEAWSQCGRAPRSTVAGQSFVPSPCPLQFLASSRTYIAGLSDGEGRRRAAAVQPLLGGAWAAGCHMSTHRPVGIQAKADLCNASTKGHDFFFGELRIPRPVPSFFCLVHMHTLSVSGLRRPRRTPAAAPTAAAPPAAAAPRSCPAPAQSPAAPRPPSR